MSSTDPEIDDDAPTERLALQRCPHCAAMTAVPLSFATSHCEVCGEEMAVCPLYA